MSVYCVSLRAGGELIYQLLSDHWYVTLTWVILGIKYINIQHFGSETSFFLSCHISFFLHSEHVEVAVLNNVQN